MSESLNVIALISGGKDSLFSLLHCIENGHKIIALANLYPPQPAQSSDENSALATDGENEVPDLNSFMYQTVGYSIIPLYASALQLPLYRRSISGTSIQQTQYYNASPAETGQQIDETEDLMPLLRQVISAHPEANAVSTGAILSTYQRTRVESIALRLGLAPIGYLWQYPVLPPPTTGPRTLDSLTALLDDMATSGLEASIIKIASAGIPEKCLFSKVTDSATRSQLVRGLTPFFQHDEMGLRGATLGEGGEYETLALSGPRSVWKGGRIEINKGSSESFVDGGVVYASLGRAKVVPHLVEEEKQEKSTAEEDEKNLVHVPGLLDHQFARVKEILDQNGSSGESQHSQFDLPLRPLVKNPNDLQSGGTQVSDQHPVIEESVPETPLPSDSTLSITIAATSATVAINNITLESICEYFDSYNKAMHALDHDSAISPAQSPSKAPSLIVSTAHDQFQYTLDLLIPLLLVISRSVELNAPPNLAFTSLSLTDIASTTMLLSSMADFPTINSIYSKIWPSGLPSPPARVTISTDLPKDVMVSLSLVLQLGPPSSRRGLHVQGRSYWAPANIGPYSQAVAVPLSLHTVKSTDQDEEEEDPLADLEVVHMAGQIPLVPSSMALHQGSFLHSSVLSLQHLWRVGQERGVDFWPWGVAYLAADACTGSYASIADKVWREAHLGSTWASSTHDALDNNDSDDDEDMVDVWDLQRNRAAYHGIGTAAMPMTVGKHLHLLPNHQIFGAGGHSTTAKLKYTPPFIAAEVNALPRNACVEWWSTGLAGLAKTAILHRKRSIAWKSKLFQHHCDSEAVRGSLSYLTITPDTDNPHITINYVTYLVASSAACPQTGRVSSVCNELPATPRQILNQIMDTDAESTNVQLVNGTAFLSSYLTPTRDGSLNTHAVLSGALQSLVTPMTTIPCRGLWGRAAATIDGKVPRTVSESVSNTDLGEKQLIAAFMMRIDSTNTRR